MIGDWEVPSIERIATLEGRRLARVTVPGLAGDLHQDLGPGSLVVEIAGTLQGDQSRDDFLNALRDKFNAGDPVTFVADILTASAVDKVLVEELEVQEVNDGADVVRYRIVLRQYVEPPPPPAPIDDLGADLGADLDLDAALGLGGLELPDVLGGLPTLADPVAPMQPALQGVQAVTQSVAGLLGALKAKLS